MSMASYLDEFASIVFVGWARRLVRDGVKVMVDP